jgi:hypothetical protein
MRRLVIICECMLIHSVAVVRNSHVPTQLYVQNCVIRRKEMTPRSLFSGERNEQYKGMNVMYPWVRVRRIGRSEFGFSRRRWK